MSHESWWMRIMVKDCYLVRGQWSILVVFDLAKTLGHSKWYMVSVDDYIWYEQIVLWNLNVILSIKLISICNIVKYVQRKYYPFHSNFTTRPTPFYNITIFCTRLRPGFCIWFIHSRGFWEARATHHNLTI